MTTIWTHEKAVDFSRDLVNSNNPKFQKIGAKLLGLKDESLINTCKLIEMMLPTL